MVVGEEGEEGMEGQERERGGGGVPEEGLGEFQNHRCRCLTGDSSTEVRK